MVELTMPLKPILQISYFFPSQLARSFCWIILFIGNLAFLLYQADGFYRKYSDAVDISDSKLSSLDTYLTEIVDYIDLELQQLQKAILPVYNQPQAMHAIHAILVKTIDDDMGVVRFAWIDTADRVRVSSVKGIYAEPPYVSHRTYLQQAKEMPDRLHISEPLAHVVTGRDIAILARGITTPAGDYAGTLVATINFPPLIEEIKQLLAHCRCRMQLSFPEDHLLLDIPGTASSLSIPASWMHRSIPIEMRRFDHRYYHIAGRLSDGDYTRLVHTHLLSTVLWLLGGNILIVILYRQFRRRILQPVDAISRAIAPYTDTQQAAVPLEMQAEQLHELLANMDTSAKRAVEMEHQLKQAITIMDRMRDTHRQFLTSSRDELHHAFDAIASYTEHLEEQVTLQQLEEAHIYDFDDVSEAGENLKFLSNGFHLICTHHSSNLAQQSEPVDPVGLLDELIHLLGPNLERRNLSISVHAQEHLILSYAPILLKHILWGPLFLAIRFAGDEHSIELHLAKTSAGMSVEIRVPSLTQTPLPFHRKDYREFMPSLQKDARAEVIAYIEQHVNLLISSQLLALHHDTLNVAEWHDKGVMITLHLSQQT